MKKVTAMDHQLYLGIDVGKTDHHATGLSAAGSVVYDKPLPQSDPRSGRCFKS